ncbi:MAG TPA: MFS transporter [Candidatus Azoamicus sp. MARI]
MKECIIENNKVRFKLFFSMFIGYMFFYFTRKSLIFVSPLVINDMNISLSEFGIINTSFYIVYAISKFISGIICDKSNPKYIMILGLMFTGILNICIMFFSYSINLILIFWILNAFFQGWGWPPINKYLSFFYTKNERGFWWSIYSLSHNLGGAVIPIIVGFLSISFGWKISIGLVGFMSVIMSFFLIKLMFIIPDVSEKKTFKRYNISNFKNIFYIINNNNIWLLGLSYLFIYIIKTAINDWAVLFLVNQKKYNLVSAGISIFYFELLGMLGMVFSGWVTDKFLFGNRIFYIFISAIFLIFFSLVFWVVPVGYQNFDYLIIGAIGFFIFGPQMLIGLIASEFVDKNFSCSANGFVGTLGYLGAALTGYPFGFIINLSWNIYFFVIVLSSFILMFIILILLLKGQI